VSIDPCRLFVLQTEPQTGAFRRLFLNGKFGHKPPAVEDAPHRFLLDTGATRLILTERMLEGAEADAVEFVGSGCPGIHDGARIPARDAGQCLVPFGGFHWSYRTARVRFLLYEDWDSGSAIARFTAEDARVLGQVVSFRRCGGDLFIKQVRPPERREDVPHPVVGCDPVLQHCLLLADRNGDGDEATAVLLLDPDVVRAARSQLLAP